MTERNVAAFLDEQKAPRLAVSVTRRADLLARHAELQKQHRDALRDDGRLNRNPEAPGLLEELYEVEEQMADSEFTFEFEGIGRHRYMRLVAQHPPRKQDKAERLDFNPDTFPAALFAASAVDPTLTVEQAEELCDRLTDGQFSKLWNTALAVNVGDDAAPKSVRRSASTAPTATSSSTAGATESPDPSSSDER